MHAGPDSPLPPSLPARADAPRIALFCRVIDNLGDAGVCWRLARQLANEKACGVTLFTDRPDVLARLWDPTRVDVALARRIEHHASVGRDANDGHLGWMERVDVRDWPRGDADLPDYDLLICAFACDLPPRLRARVSPTVTPRPLWINLDHLSAEAWVEGAHGQRSVKPADAAIEHYFLPGFTAATGGLLREADLPQRRAALSSPVQRQSWLRRIIGAPPVSISSTRCAGSADSEDAGIPEDAGDTESGAPVHTLSLFSYPVEQVTTLMELLAQAAAPTRLLVPATVAATPVGRFLGRPLLAGQTLRRGQLTVSGLPWLDQRAYDQLLWCCDLNFVRGEDSWIRAHWARRPFVWQPYPQEQPTRLDKLDAWLHRLTAGWPAATAELTAGLMHAWSGDGRLEDHWPAFDAFTRRARARQAWRDFADGLATQRDLASQLLTFAEQRRGAAQL